MEIMKVIVIIVFSYFLGNFSTGAFLAKRANVDLRAQGSGNIGTTNTLRVMGKWAGALTLVGDALKGVIAVLLGYLLLGRTGMMIAGISAVLGHDFPVLSGFKGGKGIATSVGILLIIQPFYMLMILLVCIPVIIITRYVSLASITGAIMLFVLSICLNIGDVGAWIFALLILGLALFQHRANILRLMNGTENRVSFNR